MSTVLERLCPSSLFDGLQRARKPVPKFSSFRPKDDLPISETRPKQARIDLKDNEDRRHRDEQRTGHKKGHVTHRQRQEKYLPKDQGNEDGHASRAQKDEEIAKPAEGLNNFTIDRVGDLEIISFGSLDRYKVPSYRRLGAGKVLGSLPGHRIDQNASNDRSLVISPVHGTLNLGRGLSGRPTDRIVRERRIGRQRNSPNQADLNLDFLHLNRPRERRKIETTSAAVPPELGHVQAPVTHGTPLAGPSDSEDSTSTTASQSNLSDNDKAIESQIFRRRNGELNKMVEADPSKGDAWLNLINHQAGLLGSNSTDAERKSVSDIKVSLYEKALQIVKDPEVVNALLLGIMREGERIWDKQRSKHEWANVLRAHSNIVPLWAEYLTFRQCDFNSFKFEEFRSVCEQCLDMARHQILQKSMSSEKKQEIFTSQLLIFLRTTLCMKESGFSEHALALWQSLLEFQFCAPTEYQDDDHLLGAPKWSEKVAAFETFWESEVARIGEEGGTGWLTFASDNKPHPTHPSLEPSALEGNSDLLSAWVVAEDQSSLNSQRPARTTDDLPENDPFRVILFSDIQRYLFSPPLLRCRDTTIEAFMLFCQLPVGYFDTPVAAWARSGFSHENVLLGQQTNSVISQQDQGSNGTENSTEPSETDVDRLSPFSYAVRDFQLDSATLFATSDTWIGAFEDKCRQNDWTSTKFSRQALQTLATIRSDDDRLAEYVLALEASYSPDSAKKTAKRFLKARQSSLRLYNAYALIEYQSGNQSRGHQTLIAALNMSASLEDGYKEESILLWSTFVWDSLNRNGTLQALERLQLFDKGQIDSTLR